MGQSLTDKLMNKISDSWKIRELFSNLLYTEKASHSVNGHGLEFKPSPYGQNEVSRNTDRPALFLTSQFRTGSTFLWQLMNAIDQATCYYEPLNARVWVEEAGERNRVDPTHKGVKDYAEHYLGLTHLASYHSRDWSYKNLWMDEFSADWGMKNYIDGLIEATDGFPVLQFNRVDFRLKWLRQQFPKAKIVHLIRSPRDQWISSLYGQDIDHETTIGEFAPFDKFYLLPQVKDLREVFPVLNISESEPAYCLFYLLWRLSCLHGTQHADLTIQYENLIEDVGPSIETIMSLIDRGDLRYDKRMAESLIAKPSTEKWKKFASPQWFDQKESAIEKILSSYLGSEIKDF